MWFTKFFSAPYEAKISALEATNELLRDDNESLRARLRDFEADDREIRRSLLTKAGLLSSLEQNRVKEPELKPIRKTTPPWNVAAAKLEADSKERYWKKIIEDRESLEARVSGSVRTESEQIAEDIEELSR